MSAELLRSLVHMRMEEKEYLPAQLYATRLIENLADKQKSKDSPLTQEDAHAFYMLAKAELGHGNKAKALKSLQSALEACKRSVGSGHRSVRRLEKEIKSLQDETLS